MKTNQEPEDPNKRKVYRLVKQGEHELTGYLYTSDLTYWRNLGWTAIPA
jgi:hypothetical protein